MCEGVTDRRATQIRDLPNSLKRVQALLLHPTLQVTQYSGFLFLLLKKDVRNI